MAQFVRFETEERGVRYVNTDKIQQLHDYPLKDEPVRTTLYFDDGSTLVVLGMAHQIADHLSR